MVDHCRVEASPFFDSNAMKLRGGLLCADHLYHELVCAARRGGAPSSPGRGHPWRHVNLAALWGSNGFRTLVLSYFGVQAM